MTDLSPATMATGDPATTTVNFTVTEVEWVRGCGRLVALASVELELEGVVLTMQGIRVMRQGRRFTTEAPRYRNPSTGTWLPAVIVPRELGQAIAGELQAILSRRS